MQASAQSPTPDAYAPPDWRMGALLVGFGLFLCYRAFADINDGQTRNKTLIITRAEEPGTFWVAVILEAALGVILLGMGVSMLDRATRV